MRKIKVGVISIFSILSVIVMGVFSSTVFASPAFAISPSLGALDPYSVLAGSTVTNTGFTTISGDLGVSPGSAITGFPPGAVSGTIHIADANSANAQIANAAAFSSLNQACDQTFGTVDLSTTFPAGVEPGVYCSTSNFSLSGNLNLIGSGVWIFRAASTLDTSSGSSVTGGNPCNVWWQVGSSATLDTNTSFEGNILAFVSITLNTGASINGRALAQTGAVSLNGNTIFGPNCVEAPIATDTLTLQPTETETGSPTFTQTSSETETSTDTETVTPSVTPQPSLTKTFLPTSTDTLTVSPTFIETNQTTETVTITPTNSPENTATALPTLEPATSTNSPTNTLTPLPINTSVPTLADTSENTATTLPTIMDSTTSTMSDPETATSANTVTDPTEINSTAIQATTQQTGSPTKIPVRAAQPANAVVTPILLPAIQALPDSGGAPIRDETLSWVLGIVISFGLILVAIRL